MLRSFLSVFIFIAATALTLQVWNLESQKRELKADHIEMRHIKYGLFNVDHWKDVLADVIRHKVEHFEITPQNKKKIQAEIEEVLETLIDEVEETIREQNSEYLSGLVRQLFIDAVVNMADIKEGIPEYAEIIVDRLDDSETKASLKEFIVGQMESFADETIGKMDYTVLNAIMAKYDTDSRSQCLRIIDGKLIQLEEHGFVYYLSLLIVFVLLVAMIFVKGGASLEYVFHSLSAIVFLAGGLTLPMIDIEATIAQFSFLLAGVPLNFEGQVLFFQSKSIFEVVKILISQGDIGMVFVAILATSFSIVIPVLKLTVSVISSYRMQLPSNKFSHFLLLKSGKWSMADVLVVALFMAYIGFTGVINSQLTQIEESSGSLEVITTNNSTLQAGFYFFLAYTLIGLCISQVLGTRLKT